MLINNDTMPFFKLIRFIINRESTAFRLILNRPRMLIGTLKFFIGICVLSELNRAVMRTLHECDWPCQQKDDRCDLRCPPGWTTVPTHFAICRLTELHHFHPAHKGSGSLRPFPIYPLYTQAEILSLDKPIADCFLFRPRKSREKHRKRSHTNVSSTLSTRSSTPPAQTPHVRFHT